MAGAATEIHITDEGVVLAVDVVHLVPHRLVDVVVVMPSEAQLVAAILTFPEAAVLPDVMIVGEDHQVDRLR